MSDVLGTKIRAGAPAERAVLISDLHVGTDGGRVLAGLEAAIAVAREQADALFVLGDLFDSYVCRGQIRVGIWRDVAERFRIAADDGLRIVVLVGNRDFLLGDEFVRASGAELVPGGYRLQMGGVDTLLVHGDELCQNDLPYQRAKRWLRHPITRWIARCLPVALARRVAEKARKKSQQVIHSGDQTRFLPSERAVATAFASGAQRLVFGHIHRHGHGAFGDGVYHVLPAFDAETVGLVVRGDDVQPTSFRMDAMGQDGDRKDGDRLDGERKGVERAEAVAVAMPPECPWSP